ncbi:hypothetical protein BRC68_08780 [Halobacteriales archaeon QH_6_64_20]|nr:MAG: hypothetical protein BRC68_08780 [Halobacteriales archaeon QH_6_64_20]
MRAAEAVSRAVIATVGRATSEGIIAVAHGGSDCWGRSVSLDSTVSHQSWNTASVTRGTVSMR